jgi:hypothetical protein
MNFADWRLAFPLRLQEMNEVEAVIAGLGVEDRKKRRRKPQFYDPVVLAQALKSLTDDCMSRPRWRL